MLDLSVLKNKTFDIKMIDGEVLCVKKPSKLMLIELERFSIKMRNVESIEQLCTELENITLMILNHNTDNVKVTLKKLEALEIDLSLQSAIFKGYFQFSNEVMSNPN